MTLPGPPELLPGRPDAVVDLQSEDGVELVGGRWRYADARVREIDFVEVGSPEDPLGPGTVPNRTYDVVPHAEAADFDDSGWRALAPRETQLRLANGRVCFNWYRIAVTIPERVGDLDPTGATVVFEVEIDDYAEVWINGEMPHQLGDSGGPVVAGFNAPNRVVLTRDARPGDRFSIAVFGINGPISASPRNYIWMRTATLDFYAAERARPVEELPFDGGTLERVATGFEAAAAPVWAEDGALLFSSLAGGAIYRWDPIGRVTVFRPKSAASGLAFDPDGRLTICQPERDRVIRVEPHGNITVLAANGEARDVAYRSDGRAYFADGGARGVALSPDERSLYVVDGAVVRRPVAADGTLGAADVVVPEAHEIGGIEVGAAGRLYLCAPDGIRVLAPDGLHLRTLALPEAPNDLAWGDADGQTLYVTTLTSVYRIRLDEERR